MRASWTIGCVLALAVSGCLCGGPDPYRYGGGGGSVSTLTVDNASSYVLTELRVTPLRSPDWGPNLLPDLLFPNEQITVTVACDTWDVLIVDEYGRDCVLEAIDLCFSDRLWTIDNRTLSRCHF